MSKCKYHIHNKITHFVLSNFILSHLSQGGRAALWKLVLILQNQSQARLEQEEVDATKA